MKKVLFLSKEWIDIADSVLREIVSEHGKEGQKFTVSESLANAP